MESGKLTMVETDYLKHAGELCEQHARLLAVARAAALFLTEGDGVDQKIYNIRKLKAALAAVEDLLDG